LVTIASDDPGASEWVSMSPWHQVTFASGDRAQERIKLNDICERDLAIAKEVDAVADDPAVTSSSLVAVAWTSPHLGTSDHPRPPATSSAARRTKSSIHGTVKPARSERAAGDHGLC
jgi:hypothetical protein